MGIWLLPILFLFMLLGMPISFSLGVTSLLGFLILDKLDFLSTIPQIMFAGLNSFPILAMPFFMLAGEIMNRTRITDRLIQLADVLVGYLPGGLGHANIVASVFFAGISGSAVADTSSLGPLLIPAMSENGYHKSYAAAITAASSVIGPIIPPSIIMVIYGSLMNVSIAGMFAAGIIPGLLIAVGLMAVNHFVSLKRHYPRRNNLPSIKEITVSFRKSALALFLPLIILGGILGGVFTPTEAAAVAVLYAIILGFFVYKNLDFKILGQSIQSALKTSGITLIIVSAGSLLAWLLSIERVPESLATLVIQIAKGNPTITLLIINLFLLIVGMFMDITAALIILAPILAPLAIRTGIDPLHFGIIMCINLNIGLITPPLGACLFVAASVSKLKYEQVVPDILPFIIIEIIILLTITYIPSISMWIPKLLGFAS